MLDPIPDFTETQSPASLRAPLVRRLRVPTQGATKAAAAGAADGRQLGA